MSQDKTDYQYALLTKSQRDFLAGDLDSIDLESNGPYNKRRETVERVRAGLCDGIYLSKMLDDDRRKVFTFKAEDDGLTSYRLPDRYPEDFGKVGLKVQDETKLGPPSYSHLTVGFMHLFGFVYRGFREKGMTPNRFFERFLDWPIKQVESDIEGVRDGLIETQFGVKIHEASDLSPEEKLERNMSLTTAEVKDLHESGYFD